MLDKIIHLVQTKLGKLEIIELEELTRQSQDEAVRIALMLAAQPAPPMPEFAIDPKYTDPEKLADLVDDIFKGTHIRRNHCLRMVINLTFTYFIKALKAELGETMSTQEAASMLRMCVGLKNSMMINQVICTHIIFSEHSFLHLFPII